MRRLPQQRREPREVSLARFRARDRIGEAIHRIRNSQLYKEPQPWKVWADAFLGEQDTPTLAQRAYNAAFELARSDHDARSLDYFRAVAAYFAARAGIFYIHQADAAKVHAEMACVCTIPDAVPSR